MLRCLLSRGQSRTKRFAKLTGEDAHMSGALTEELPLPRCRLGVFESEDNASCSAEEAQKASGEV